MSQRMQFTLGIVMTAACVASAVSVWRTSSERGLPAHADANEAMIDRLDRLIAAVEANARPPESDSKPSDWVNLQFRLVQRRPEGPPAEGFKVEFPEIRVAPGVPFIKVSGPTGLVDLGLVHASRHSFRVTSPWNQICEFEFDIRPGSGSQTEVVVCPTEPPPQAEVTISVDWPEDLRVANVGLIGKIHSPTLELHGWKWLDLDQTSYTVFFAADGKIMNYGETGFGWNSKDGQGWSGWPGTREERLDAMANQRLGEYTNLSASATLDTRTQPLTCRGTNQICDFVEIGIIESRRASEYPRSENPRVLIIDSDCQVKPRSLVLNRGGTNQFEIVLSQAKLTEIRNVLREHTTAALNSSRD
ncbi:MAG: hypothetical protein HY290_17380 [Planctomycetia bacterium]|nr:hypothetical protein [Planctomycetia bacterium]